MNVFIPKPVKFTIKYKRDGKARMTFATLRNNESVVKVYDITPIEVDADHITAYVFATNGNKPGIRTFIRNNILDAKDAA